MLLNNFDVPSHDMAEANENTVKVGSLLDEISDSSDEDL